MDIPGFLTVQQAADRLGVHRGTIWRHIVAGDLPTYRTPRNGRVRLLDLADIEAIERVTREPQRPEWSGKDWTDYMIDAGANREGAADVMANDVWAEQEPERLPAREPDLAAWDDDEGGAA